jgi:hypothetical protein
MPVFPNALGGSYVLESPISSQIKTMNLRMQISEQPGATSKISFYRTPGVSAFATAPTAGWSATFEMNGRAFGVSGNTFYEVTYPANVGTLTARGTLLVGTDPATIWANGPAGDQLLVTSGSSLTAGMAGNAYVYDLTANTLTEISTLVGKATQGGYLNGYGLVFDQVTGTVYYSDLFDFSVFDPANFWKRSNQPDKYQGMQVTSWNYIWLPGGQTGEAWYPNGGFPLPFAPDPAGNFNSGIAATFSLQNVAGAICWLSTGHDGGLTVQAATGLQPQTISDLALAQELASYTRIDDCIGQGFQYKGQNFLRLTFPTEKKTKQYDFLSKAWTDVGTWISEDDDYTYFRPVYHMYAFGKHLMGDRESGVLYDMADTHQMDVEGRPLRWFRRMPSVVNETDYVFHRKLSLLPLVGVGNAGLAVGYDPQVMLSYSDNGGRTWGTEIQASLGAEGAYDTLLQFWQLGMARNRVYELSGTDPVVTAFTEVYLTAEKAA